jgi:hypothetical protein
LEDSQSQYEPQKRGTSGIDRDNPRNGFDRGQFHFHPAGVHAQLDSGYDAVDIAGSSVRERHFVDLLLRLPPGAILIFQECNIEPLKPYSKGAK